MENREELLFLARTILWTQLGSGQAREHKEAVLAAALESSLDLAHTTAVWPELRGAEQDSRVTHRQDLCGSVEFCGSDQYCAHR